MTAIMTSDFYCCNDLQLLIVITRTLLDAPTRKSAHACKHTHTRRNVCVQYRHDLPKFRAGIVLYCIVFNYLYSAPQQPWANRGAFGSISSKKIKRHELKVEGDEFNFRS